ncbi:prepilin-type N-terminal cleavage/methylation domain-containing protein [bacterium]|nr:prepilin-type N-terminal cleavage/methylation domain-containing protein [bacterium]
MKKNGYTLAEALISLAVIGVVAALILPMANKLQPDTTKIMFLKTYDSIVEITQQLASNTQIYPLYDDNSNIYYEQYPLANLSAWSDSQNNQHRMNSKYCTLLANAFGSTNNTCSNDNILINNFNFNFTPSFTATNGVVFDIRTFKNIWSNNNVERMTYQSDIYIDVDGINNGNDCFYNFDTGCTQPDRFKIIVASDGKIVASDPKSQYYLDTRVDAKLVKDLGDLENDYQTRILNNNDQTKVLIRN